MTSPSTTQVMTDRRCLHMQSLRPSSRLFLTSMRSLRDKDPSRRIVLVNECSFLGPLVTTFGARGLRPSAQTQSTPLLVKCISRVTRHESLWYIHLLAADHAILFDQYNPEACSVTVPSGSLRYRFPRGVASSMFEVP
ncbi:hypothetical protein BDZ89DRAFT_1064501 [Hymenopellis radicata]|nr:hypothetical protein BDZ89DRAFT_1064501 [Hymenopellis radicata]